MKRIFLAGRYLTLAAWLSGCSTVQGDFHQKLQIDVLDAQNHPVNGMRCQVGSGDSAQSVVTPATDVRVRRAFMSLEIECRRDNLAAAATVESRRERMEEALLPFGSVGIFIDHVSGSLYGYPTTIHLRVGQHVVLEQGGEAVVTKAEPVTAHQVASAQAASVVAVPSGPFQSGPFQSGPFGASPSAQPTASAPQTAQSAPFPTGGAAASGPDPTVRTSTHTQVAQAAQKTAAPPEKAGAPSAHKLNRTTVKSAKTTRTTLASTKPRSAPPKIPATPIAAGTSAPATKTAATGTVTTRGAIAGTGAVSAGSAALLAAPVNW